MFFQGGAIPPEFGPLRKKKQRRVFLAASQDLLALLLFSLDEAYALDE